MLLAGGASGGISVREVIACDRTIILVPLPARIAVTHRLECGSHPAAPAVLAIRRRALRFTHGPQRRGACSSHPSDLTIRDELAVREQWRGSQASSLPISLLSYPVTLVQVMEEHKR